MLAVGEALVILYRRWRLQPMTKQNKNPSIFGNILANWAAFIFVAAVSFFLSPFVVRNLGDTGYGVWSLLSSLVGYFGLLDFGVRGAITRYIAHHYSLNEHENSGHVIFAGMVLFGFLGATTILVSLVVAALSPMLFNIPMSFVYETRVVIVLGGLATAVTLIAGVFGGVSTGLQRFDINSGIEILLTVFRAVATVIALREGYGLISLAAINLAVAVLYFGIYLATIWKLYPQLRLQFPISLGPYLKKILSFSSYSSLITLFGMIIYYSDTVVIAAFLPIGAVTIFVISGNLCEYASQVVRALSKIMLPRVSALASVNSTILQEEIIGMAKIATLTSSAIAATFWLRGESFINLWMGTEYGTESGKVLRVLAWVVWLSGARQVAVQSIVGMNRHRSIVPLLAVEALLNLGLSIVLITSLGTVGVALGTVIPSLLISLGFIPRLLFTATGVPTGMFYRDAWLIPTLACAPFALANICLENICPARSLAMFFIQLVLILPLVPSAAMILCLNSIERQKMILAIKTTMGKWLESLSKTSLKGEN